MNEIVRLLVVAMLLMLGTSPGAAAQWPADITPGVRVQLRLPEAQFQAAGRRGHLLRGRIVQLAPDSLYLYVTDSLSPVAIPRSLILQIDRRGVPSRPASALW